MGLHPDLFFLRRVRRRDLHVLHRDLGAGVPDEGGQGVLELAPSYPLLLRLDHPWYGREPWPGHLRHDQRRQRGTRVSADMG